MASTAPRWKLAIDRAFTDAKPVAQLATIDVVATKKPHVRTIGVRGFLEPAGNPDLPLILASTDIRTPKVKQVLADPAVELVIWASDAQEQFRIGGTAALVCSPQVEPTLYTKCLDAPTGVRGPTRVYKAFQKDNFDWEKKRLEFFESHSPFMKAAWCRPVPGSPLVGGESEAKKWPQQIHKPDPEHPDPTAQELWDTALRNFALLLIDPHDVDYVELGVTPHRRTRFWRTDIENDKNDAAELWEEEQLVP